MTWNIKTMHKQIQSKKYKAQGALTAASTTVSKSTLETVKVQLLPNVKKSFIGTLTRSNTIYNRI